MKWNGLTHVGDDGSGAALGSELYFSILALPQHRNFRFAQISVLREGAKIEKYSSEPKAAARTVIPYVCGINTKENGMHALEHKIAPELFSI